MDPERKNKLLELREYSEKAFDNLLVYLNSGALILSLGFVENIVDLSTSLSIKMLKWSWVLFVVSLVIILFSHRLSKTTMTLELKGKKKVSDVFDVVTDCFNWFSLVCFISGLVLFITFILKNL